MNEIEIAELHDKIFAHLYQKYLDAKERGEEFYFLLAPRYGFGGGPLWDIAGRFYWLNWMDGRGSIQLNFWDNHYCGITFIIQKKEDTMYSFSCILQINPEYFRHYPNGKSDKIEKLANSLKEKDNKWHLKNSTDYDGFIYYRKEYDDSSNVLTGLDYFIDTDKKKIDTFILDYDKINQPIKTPCLITKEDFEYQLRWGNFLKQKMPTIENPLPIALTRFFIQRYQAIEDVEISFIPPSTQWIFLTGENAKGKTSILQTFWQALTSGEIFKENYVLGFGGAIEVFQDNYYRNTNFYSKVERFSENQLYTKMDKKTAKPLSILGGGLNIPKIAVFGSSRLSTVKEYVKNRNPFGTEPFLNNMNSQLFKRGISDKYKYQFEILEETFKKLLPNLSRIQIDKNELEDTKNVLYYEKDENGNELGKVTFEELATGYQNIINLIGNIILQLSDEIDGEIHINKLDDLYGIVIIDEIELHLHPKMQRFLVEKLTELFPKVQFIVSTHSPIPLLGAPKETVILHVDRTQEKGITVERLDDKIDFHKLLPEALLSSPIFDFDSFLHRTGNKFEPFSTESDYNEIVFHKMLKQKAEKLAHETGKKLADIFTDIER